MNELYILDACALIAFLRDEAGADDRLEKRKCRGSYDTHTQPQSLGSLLRHLSQNR